MKREEEEKQRGTGARPKWDFSNIEPKKINFYNSEKMQNVFVYLSKEQLSQLSISEKAVYIVLCCKAENEKDSWIALSQSMTAQFSGLSRKTVNKAYKSLQEKGLVEFSQNSKQGSHNWEYAVDFYRGDQISAGKENNDLFQFYKSIVLNGTWSKLTIEAKALYLGMRNLAYCVGEVYTTIEEEFKESTELGDWMRYDYYSRKWDQMSLKKFNKSICTSSGLNPKQIPTALEELEYYDLAVLTNQLWGFPYGEQEMAEEDYETEQEGFQVYLRPRYDEKTVPNNL